MRRIVAPVVLGALLVLVSACGGDDASGEDIGGGSTPEPIPASSVTAIPGGPRLLVSTVVPEPDPIGRDAMVTGKLSLNAKDCFQLGDSILVAPYGSNIVDGGKSVEMTGYGRFELGDQVKGGGWYMPAARPEVDPAWRGCIVDKKRDHFVFPNDLPR